MRFEQLYQIVRRRGFYFSAVVYPYGLAGQVKKLPLAFGVGLFLKTRFLALIERPSFRRLYQKASFSVRLPRLERFRNLSYQWLRWVPGHINPPLVVAWRLALYIRLSHLRGIRYCLGMPSRGQRTHANAKTARRLRGQAFTLAGELTGYKLFNWTKQKSYDKRAAKGRKGQLKTVKKSAKGAPKKLKKKKLDVWR